MQNLENVNSQLLIEEIQRRFNERESTIDEMSKMMSKMEEINKKLLKAEENKGKFMSIIKNEFNNPLYSMVSMSKSLLKNSDDEKVQLIGNSLQEEALLLNFQIKNIITAAEIESGTLDIQNSKINFQDIVLQVKEELQYPIEHKNTKFKINISSENDFSLDREKVYQILINLISNAIEFSPKDSNIEIDILEEIDDCKIIVKDYGEGIDDHEKDKIFQRFYQAHSGMNRAHRGQGLGLSVVRDLVDFMNGEIKFDSKLESYTIFEITLPKCGTEDDLFGDDDFMFDGGDGSTF